MSGTNKSKLSIYVVVMIIRNAFSDYHLYSEYRIGYAVGFERADDPGYAGIFSAVDGDYAHPGAGSRLSSWLVALKS